MHPHITANCITIAQFPIESHSEQGRFAELPLKTIGKLQIWGSALCNSQHVAFLFVTSFARTGSGLTSGKLNN